MRVLSDGSRQVVRRQVKLTVPPSTDRTQLLTLKPLDPGIVFEKIVVDCGGYQKSYLFMDESPCKEGFTPVKAIALRTEPYPFRILSLFEVSFFKDVRFRYSLGQNVFFAENKPEQVRHY